MESSQTVSFETILRDSLESLILAQNERWRRGLGMQVERERRKSQQWDGSPVERRTGEYKVGNVPSGGGQLRETGANTAYVPLVFGSREERCTRQVCVARRSARPPLASW